ncbi:MAG: hypothetical protein IKW33_00840 [Clostridia bacterium]|nr:hypothetical protein [Clostridia bacterium]
MLKRKEMLFVDFPAFSKITKEVKQSNKTRTFTGGVRINNAMYRTAEEDKNYREQSLKRKLP